MRSAIGGTLTPEDVLATNGKRLCGSARADVKAVHMLNVWSHQRGLCLSSTAVASKSNEMTALPSLLDTLSLLELAGCIITVDALNSQREVARKLIEHDADYVMALKGNQPKLHEDVVWLFEDALETGFQGIKNDLHETNERGHGRSERRPCLLLSELSYLQEHRWPGLRSVARVTCERTSKGKTSVETRYYLCSFKAEAARVLHAVRTHWEVENKLHWTLDVVFGEDRHDYAERQGAENMSVLRQFALNLLRQNQSPGSLKGKRKKAAWDDDFRTCVLKGLLPN